MRVASMRAVTICLLIYTLIGLFGWLRLRHDTQGNILNNYCLLDHARACVGEPPKVMVPAFMITVTVLMAYPVNMYPTRFAIEVMCYPKVGHVQSPIARPQQCACFHNAFSP